MRILVQQNINAAPEVVFAASTNIEAWPEYFSGIKRVDIATEGPVGVGTTFRETRIMMKREATEEMMITAFDPPREYVVESDSCGSHFHTSVRMHPGREGTCMELEMVTRPMTLVAWLMAPIALMMKGLMKKLIARDLKDLANFVEASN